MRFNVKQFEMFSDSDHSEQTETESESRDEHINVDTANAYQKVNMDGKQK